MMPLTCLYCLSKPRKCGFLGQPRWYYQMDERNKTSKANLRRKDKYSMICSTKRQKEAYTIVKLHQQITANRNIIFYLHLLTWIVVRSENSPDSDSTTILPSIEPIGLVQCTIRFSNSSSFEMPPIKLIEGFPHLSLSLSSLEVFIVPLDLW